MKTTTLEIPASVLSMLAACPSDPKYAVAVCAALVEAAAVDNGVNIKPDVPYREPDVSQITVLAERKVKTPPRNGAKTPLPAKKPRWRSMT